MLTGTPLDLTPFGSLLQGIGILYWLVVIAVLVLVVGKMDGALKKLLSGVVVIAILVGPVAVYVWKKHEQQQQFKARLDAAMAHFEMRCKGTGEKIARTVENVEGVFLMKIRPKDSGDLEPEQFRLNDPYGRDLTGDGYIETFLWGRNADGRVGSLFTARAGYRYVDAVDLRDGTRYRYTGFLADPNHFQLEKKAADSPMPRYGVTYGDISTREDRERWIAGSSLRIIDLQTNEVIAERIGYMIDRGQGDKSGFRSPWLFARYNACPPFPPVEPGRANSADQSKQTRNFVEKVLKPITGQGD